VLRVPGVARIVEQEMTKRERRAYDAAVEALRGEGCRAGGKRLAAVGDDDSPMCQRSLYADWRMITIYRQDESVVIIAVGRHTNEGSPAEELAETFRDLSASGRRRSDQPPCCEDAAAPPTLSDELEARVFDLFGV
jgi:hypothetical protein